MEGRDGKRRRLTSKTFAGSRADDLGNSALEEQLKVSCRQHLLADSPAHPHFVSCVWRALLHEKTNPQPRYVEDANFLNELGSWNSTMSVWIRTQDGTRFSFACNEVAGSTRSLATDAQTHSLRKLEAAGIKWERNRIRKCSCCAHDIRNTQGAQFSHLVKRNGLSGILLNDDKTLTGYAKLFLRALVAICGSHDDASRALQLNKVAKQGFFAGFVCCSACNDRIDAVGGGELLCRIPQEGEPDRYALLTPSLKWCDSCQCFHCSFENDQNESELHLCEHNFCRFLEAVYKQCSANVEKYIKIAMALAVATHLVHNYPHGQENNRIKVSVGWPEACRPTAPGKYNACPSGANLSMDGTQTFVGFKAHILDYDPEESAEETHSSYKLEMLGEDFCPYKFLNHMIDDKYGHSTLNSLSLEHAGGS